MRAEHYHLRLVEFASKTAIPITYTDGQLANTKTIDYLRAMNREGYNIYARPMGLQYVLLDDLRRGVLDDLATIQPCALLETSPANYQAWLIMPDIPPHRDDAKAICRELAGRFGADMASADPDHVGRLPGFTNRKEKHQQSNGQYPFIRLRRSEYRVSTFNPCGGVVPSSVQKTNSPVRHVLHQGRTDSERDYGRACWLIRQGKLDTEIHEYLLSNSPNLVERKGSGRRLENYLRITIENAHKAVNRE